MTQLYLKANSGRMVRVPQDKAEAFQNYQDRMKQGLLTPEESRI